MRLEIGNTTLKRLNFLYFSLAIIFTVLLFLPREFFIAVYSPSILGWIVVFIVIVEAVLFLFLISYDIYRRSFKLLLIKILTIMLIILVALIMKKIK